ncbi:KAP family NTPase [Mesorhizobium sp. M0621]|uniref:P-loop NTPase fold protein n=1 Tax=Mesorhizobium sp. M0621 TaxID=2956974 RepID=UPI00333D9E27
MSKADIRRNILLDEPSEEDLFHGQGHDRTAAALASAIRNFKDADRAIGLDGPWGSGKSSVVGIAERKLHQSNGNGKINFSFFAFDIWKSQGSAFRRSFLEHFISWAKIEFPKKLNKLSILENKIRGKIREVDTDNNLILDWYGIAVLLSVPFIPIYVLWSKSKFDELTILKNQSEYLYSAPMILVYGFLIVTFTVAILKYRTNPTEGTTIWARFRFALSRTLLIGAKQYEHQKVTQYIRETDPNDFEFQSILREILVTIQDQNNKVVMVLDNIDRLPPNEITEYWALVRSIFSRTHSEAPATTNNHITAIVPYDRRLIEPASSSEPHDKTENPNSSLKSKEIFAKTFDEILTVAPPVMSNTRDFFKDKMAQSLPDLSDEDALFRVYLIFNWIIDAGGGRATPRQVISYINELAGLYVLHGGQIGAPTVAVYLAVQNKLENKPSALAKENLVDDHLRSLAGDKNLEKNLAAILFNVEPELAFQILLDGEIKSAAAAESSNKLIDLSKAPGFDVRLNEVFSDNTSEWTSSGRFSVVVSNISDLLGIYRGEAAFHLNKSMVESFCNLPFLNLGREATLYQKLIGVCLPDDRQRVADHFLQAASIGIAEGANLDQSRGRQFVRFLSEFSKAMREASGNSLPDASFKKVTLPSNPLFLFGFAAETRTTSVSMTKVAKFSIDLSSHVDLFETLAVDQTADSLAAFAEFKTASIVSDEQWISIATHLVLSLVGEILEDEGLIADRVSLLSRVFSYTGIAKSKNIDLSLLFSSSTFYENLFLAFSEKLDDEGVAHAAFLASDMYLAGGLPSPVRAAPNGLKVASAQDEFAWFGKILDGSSVLTPQQHTIVAEQAVAIYRLPRWIAFGAANPSNTFVTSVIRAAFARDRAPWVNAGDLFKYYQYLKQVLGAAFDGLLPKLGTLIETNALAKLGAESYPPDILVDTKNLSDREWKAVHAGVTALLDDVSKVEWLDHLTSGDNLALLMFQKAKSSGYKPDSTALKDSFAQFILGVLDGSIVPSHVTAEYDTAMKTVDAGYHLEFFKFIREHVDGVTAETINLASRLAPQLLSSVVRVGEKSKREKENLVRQILRPALEGGVTPVLDSFLELGRKAVADFIRSSEKSTQDALEPALRLFSNTNDREYVRKISELVQGRKAKTWLDVLFGTKDSGDD